jgi:hypothetical protein
MLLQSSLLALLSATASLACDSCYGPANYDIHTRFVRRQQPEALNATTLPRAPLEWGQLNFLHTTDTHAWLAGHLKEQNYGADWGDFVSFTRRMRQKAGNLGVDLLLVDTGKLPNSDTDSRSQIDRIPQAIYMMAMALETQLHAMVPSLTLYSRKLITMLSQSATTSSTRPTLLTRHSLSSQSTMEKGMLHPMYRSSIMQLGTSNTLENHTDILPPNKVCESWPSEFFTTLLAIRM